jgi:DNA-binding NarL/FixJ family response regulator
MSERPLRIVLADDQALVRAGFRLMLNAQSDMEVVAEAANGLEAVAACRRSQPDIVLMDVRMPELDGLEATRRVLSGGGTQCRVVILTTFDLDEYVYSALQAGASGFLLKDVSPEHLIAGIRLVAAGEGLLAPSITRRLIERYVKPSPQPTTHAKEALASLTPREEEVLKLVARGLSNAEIADALILSEATVKTHVARILSKLDLRDRVQAVVFAYESALIEPSARTP